MQWIPYTLNAHVTKTGFETMHLFKFNFSIDCRSFGNLKCSMFEALAQEEKFSQSKYFSFAFWFAFDVTPCILYMMLNVNCITRKDKCSFCVHRHSFVSIHSLESFFQSTKLIQSHEIHCWNDVWHTHEWRTQSNDIERKLWYSRKSLGNCDETNEGLMLDVISSKLCPINARSFKFISHLSVYGFWTQLALFYEMLVMMMFCF